MKGFSRSNLLYMRAFAEAWYDEQIVQQLVGQLTWGHNLVLITKLPTSPRASIMSKSHYLEKLLDGAEVEWLPLGELG